MTKQSLNFIVRVLTYQGYIEADYTPADLVPHLKEISERYRILSVAMGFTEAMEQAKTEWLETFIEQEGNK